MATKKQIWEKILKTQLNSEAVWGIKLKLCRIVFNNSLYKKKISFIAIAQALWLLWQLKVSTDLHWEK